MVYQLDDDLWFPSPYDGEDDGCIAIGGDLSVDRLILAYANGIFPWYPYKKEAYGDQLKDDEEVPIQWFCPLDRFVFFPDKIHISHSMRNVINRNIYTATVDLEFERVIKACAEIHGGDRFDWLGPQMVDAYIEMHNEGLAHSCEVWDDDAHLVGGLYGVLIGKVFYGESMFCTKPNASKFAFIKMCEFLHQNGIVMIDSQVENSHTKSLGGVHIPYEEYMKIVEEGLNES